MSWLRRKKPVPQGSIVTVRTKSGGIVTFEDSEREPADMQVHLSNCLRIVVVNGSWQKWQKTNKGWLLVNLSEWETVQVTQRYK